MIADGASSMALRRVEREDVTGLDGKGAEGLRRGRGG